MDVKDTGSFNIFSRSKISHDKWMNDLMTCLEVIFVCEKKINIRKKKQKKTIHRIKQIDTAKCSRISLCQIWKPPYLNSVWQILPYSESVQVHFHLTQPAQSNAINIQKNSLNTSAMATMSLLVVTVGHRTYEVITSLMSPRR